MIRSTVLKQNKFSSEAITLATPSANKIKQRKRKGEKVMARNYTLSEVVDIIVKGEDMEAITDIGRRFPVLAVKIAGLAAVAGEQFNDFASYIPEYVSANKVNGMIKKAIGEDSGDAEDTDEEAAAKPAGKKAEKPATKKKEAKEDADADADEDEVDYSSMTAPELFKECKKRGIKAELKKPAKYYIGLLKKADEEAAEDDDWGEEEEEKPAKKPAKAADKKPAKKEAKKAADEDEDEDWDI